MLTASRPEAQKRLICTPAALEIPAGLERGHLGQHGALVAHGRHHPHHHVVHLGRVELVALLQVGQQTGQQVDGLDLVQAAVFLAFAAWVRMASNTNASVMGVSPESNFLKYIAFYQAIAL
jgi:hypothetical protein